ncbi:hypothetical protein MHU86_10404 [Fragilaria crotonensis]|nr:hypothetical protein MHU86_10404 [Fragilaria crotonensis]
MQLRLNDVKVNDVPRFLTENPDELTHSLVVPMDDAEMPYIIPLSLKGVASSFPTRKPTLEEYESLPHLVLTGDLPDYDPHDPTFAAHEETLTKIISDSGDRISAATSLQRICSISNRNLVPEIDRVQLSLRSISVTLDDDTLAGAVRQTTIRTIRTATSQNSSMLHICPRIGESIYIQLVGRYKLQRNVESARSLTRPCREDSGPTTGN